MTRILHTADWQIGRQYGQMAADDAHALSEARFAAVARLAGAAVEHHVQAVLVAGDVFDAQTISDRSIRRTFNAMAEFPGPWILIPGNHDAALSESVWTRATRLSAIPSHVHALLEPGVRVFADQGLAILAAPLIQRHTYDDLTAWFDNESTPANLCRIGIAHGCVEGILPQDIDSANPIASNRVETARLDYLALGDWHGCRQINSRCWYAGTPEPDRFRDNDAGQALVVDIDHQAASVQGIRIGQFQWRDLSFTINGPADIGAMVSALETMCPADVLRLRLSGSISLRDQAQLDQFLGSIEARVRSLRVDRQQLALIPNEDDIASLHADGYLSEVIDDLQHRQQGPEGGVAREALTILATILRKSRNDSGKS